MTETRIRQVTVWCILSVLLAMLTADGAAAQSSPAAPRGLPKLPDIRPFGVDAFRLMLQQRGLIVTQQRAGTALQNPHSTVLVVMGQLNTVERITEQLNSFVAAGGALLLASDLCGAAQQKRELWGGRIVRHRARYAGQHRYRQLEDCPVITDFATTADQALLAGVTSLVANRPARLRLLPGAALRPLAWLPGRSRSRNYGLLASRRSRGYGRVLVAADHSLFINEMLAHASNARFANNVAHWLCEGGQRQHLVFIHDGALLPAWGLGQRPPAIPLSTLIKAAQSGALANLPIGDQVMPVLNASLEQYQQTDGPNNWLRKQADWLVRFGDARRQARPLRFALLVLTAGVLLYFVRWLLTARTRPQRFYAYQDWNQTPDAPLAAALRHGQYHAAIQHIGRRLFRRMGFPTTDQPPSRTAARARPPVVKDAPSSQRRQVQRDVRWLWKWTTTSRPRRLGRRRYTQLLAAANRVGRLHQRGQLRLE